MGRSFVVLTVPAAETLIGKLTQDEPGCTIDLLGRPLVLDGEHRYDLHYIVRGVSPEGKEAVEAQLHQVYTRFETLDYHREQGIWTVSAEVPVADIRSPGLRFIAGLFGLAPMPWVVFEDGMAEARLLPGRQEMIAQVAETLEKRLELAGIHERARVEEADWHERFLARVQAAGWSPVV